MRRLACALAILLQLSISGSPQTPHPQRTQPETWYERILRRINPDEIDYGALWERRKQYLIGQLGNPYFQYSLAATVAIVVLLAISAAQRLSYRRALSIATQSITDVLCHDAYSRQIAEEAIQRYNDHIEGCNRAIELGQDRLTKSTQTMEAALQRLRQELADTRQENKSLREELAKARGTQDQPVQTEMEFAPAQYIARINTLEKQLRAEQRKNRQAKGTSVDDHRA
jgi:hypothetical protein